MKKVLIVGAGIAGLTAGVYARQCGFEAVILESHTIPGGNSTAWKRKGYFFEGGMHWLTGSSDKTALNRIWREIGALQENNPIHLRDPFLSYIGDKGERVNLYRDLDKLKTHLLSVSPQDKAAILRLCKDIRAMCKLSMPVMDLKGVKAKYPSKMSGAAMLGMLSALPTMGRLQKITTGDYADRFTHKGIRTILHNVVGLDRFNAMSLIVTLGTLAFGDGGYPKGGALQMAQNIVDTFKTCGGELRYNARVKQVIIKNGRACGALLDSGEELTADAVIVTADTLTANDTLFMPLLNEPWQAQMKNEILPVNCTFICLGIKADLKNMPDSFLVPLKKPFVYAGLEYRELGFHNYANYEGYAPSGCTSLTCYLGKSDAYDMWQAAKQDGSYAQRKKELAEAIINQLESALPAVKGLVEVWDVATPLTYERYCSTYHGSWMSVLTTDKKRLAYPSKAETVSGLYFAGQRIAIPGGLPSAVNTARQAVQHLCLDTDTVFQNDL